MSHHQPPAAFGAALSDPGVAPARTAVLRLMAVFEPPWVVCGGWAIDGFLSRLARAHMDVDIAVFRRDQLALQSYRTARG